MFKTKQAALTVDPRDLKEMICDVDLTLTLQFITQNNGSRQIFGPSLVNAPALDEAGV